MTLIKEFLYIMEESRSGTLKRTIVESPVKESNILREPLKVYGGTSTAKIIFVFRQLVDKFIEKRNSIHDFF